MEYVSIRVWKRTQHNLRVVAALLDTSMLEVLDRLVKQELERVQKGNDHAGEPKDQAQRD